MNHIPAVGQRYHDLQTFQDSVSRVQDQIAPDCGMLRISLTGGVFLSFEGQDVPLPNRKARAMLAVLALNNPPEESRERLTGLLWSESEQSRAQATLRQAVHETRQALIAAGCNALVAGRLTVGLRPGTFEVDTAEMVAELERGELGLVPRDVRLMDVLLAGLDDLDPSFSEWVSTRRQNANDRLLRALTNAFRDSRIPRRQRRTLAEAALLQDPANEEACRTVMRCAAEEGETGAALRAYDALYSHLGEDFDMEPSAATQALVAAIKQGEFDVAPTVAPIVRATPEPTRGGGPPWIAVMPFRTVGPDTVPSYLADGLTEDIVRTLAGVRELIVISSNSTRMFPTGGTDPRRVERELGVQYVVSGTARSTGRGLRLSVELADAATRAVHWAHAFDAEDGMLFDAQDRIVEQIVNSLAPRVHEAELQRIRLQRPHDLSAYHLTLEARDLIFRLEPESFDQAGRLLRQAISLEPGYAAAHGALAGWYSLRLGLGWSEDPALDVRTLNRCANAAVRLDSSNARALALLGNGKTVYERDHAEAVRLTNRALEMTPNDAEVLLWSSPTRAYIGESYEAERLAARALRLSPRDPFVFRTYHFLCIAYYARKAYDEASHWGNLSYYANPRYTSNLRLTAASLFALGRVEEASEMAGRAKQLDPGFKATRMLERWPFHDAARRALYVEHLIGAGIPA